MKHSLLLSLIAAGILTGCSSLISKPTETSYFRVADSEIVNDSSWKTGALVGGALGVATSIGHGAESTAIRLSAGAALGAGAEKMLTRNSTRNEIRVVDSHGSLWVFDYDDEVVSGECLEITQLGRGKTIIRKSDTTWCDF